MPDLITVVNMIPTSLSGETNQDSEPNLAVNPANTQEIAGTAFTPSPGGSTTRSPIFFSSDGGATWSVRDIIAGTPVRDQTVRFASLGGTLYAGVLWGTGSNIAFINFDILRTQDFSGLNVMTRLARRQNDDQPFVQAATVPAGPNAGKDRIYVGSNDHAPANIPSTMDSSLDAGAAIPTVSTFVLEGRTVVRDGFQTRPAIHPDGTVYALFYALISGTTSTDVVIVRDDSWGSGGSPYRALIDPGDANQGVRIVTGVTNPFLSMNLGQQRIGGDLSITVDPRRSATVYVCWGDLQGGTYTLHIRKSVDAGVTWPASDIRTITNATNPSLAMTSDGLGCSPSSAASRDDQRRAARTARPGGHRDRAQPALADDARDHAQRLRLVHDAHPRGHPGEHPRQELRPVPGRLPLHDGGGSRLLRDLLRQQHA